LEASGVAVVAHRTREIAAGVKNSPDIHDLIAHDVEHEIREAGERADAEVGNPELIRESQVPVRLAGQVDV
jgi:hypothetical protein